MRGAQLCASLVNLNSAILLADQQCLAITVVGERHLNVNAGSQ